MAHASLSLAPAARAAGGSRPAIHMGRLGLEANHAAGAGCSGPGSRREFKFKLAAMHGGQPTRGVCAACHQWPDSDSESDSRATQAALSLRLAGS